MVALGRVLAAGLIPDGDAVDIVQYALDAISEMGRLHVSLLDLLVRYEPGRDSRGYRAVPHRVPSYLPMSLAPAPGARTYWSIGRREWEADLIPIVRPELDPVLSGLAGSLIRHGLAQQSDRTREAMEQLGKDFHGRMIRQASAARRGLQPTPIGQRAPAISRVERSWLPTELGEIVLGYYLEAGADAGSTTDGVAPWAGNGS